MPLTGHVLTLELAALSIRHINAGPRQLQLRAGAILALAVPREVGLLATPMEHGVRKQAPE